MNVRETYFHADYRDLIDRQVEYTPAIAIRIDGRGPANGCDLAKVQLESTYWAPPKSLHPHMHAMVVKHGPRKLRVARGDVINRQFSLFPVGYDAEHPIEQSFEDAEGRKSRKQTKLVRMLIDDTVRVNFFDPTSGVIRLQRSNYLDQLASNITCDEPFDVAGAGFDMADAPVPTRPDAFTFRELDRDALTGRLRPMEACYQANTMGVGALFFDADGVPLLRPRGYSGEQIDGQVAVMPNGVHWTSSGAMQWQDFPADRQLATLGFIRATQREIMEETEIPASDYTLTPLCFAREFARGGKPQLFFAATFNRELRLADGSLIEYLMNKCGQDSWETLNEQRANGRLVNFFSKVRRKRQGPHEIAHWHFRSDMRLAAFDSARPNRFPEWSKMTYECRAALYFAAQFVQAWQAPTNVKTSTP